MTSLGDGICGFKLDNVGENFVPRWNISFIDENADIYYRIISVNSYGITNASHEINVQLKWILII